RRGRLCSRKQKKRSSFFTFASTADPSTALRISPADSRSALPRSRRQNVSNCQRTNCKLLGPGAAAIELMAANAAISLQHFQNRSLGARSQYSAVGLLSLCCHFLQVP